MCGNSCHALWCRAPAKMNLLEVRAEAIQEWVVNSRVCDAGVDTSLNLADLLAWGRLARPVFLKQIISVHSFPKRKSKCCNTAIPQKRGLLANKSWTFNAHQKWLRKQSPVRKEARWSISSERVDCRQQFESLRKPVLSTCVLENVWQLAIFPKK